MGGYFKEKLKCLSVIFFNEKKNHLAFHRVLQLYTLLNTSYRCQQDMIFLIYKILICIHVSCWTCMSTNRSKICIVCLVIGVRPFTERTLVQILLHIDGCWRNKALGLHTLWLLFVVLLRPYEIGYTLYQFRLSMGLN